MLIGQVPSHGAVFVPPNLEPLIKRRVFYPLAWETCFRFHRLETVGAVGFVLFRLPIFTFWGLRWTRACANKPPISALRRHQPGLDGIRPPKLRWCRTNENEERQPRPRCAPEPQSSLVLTRTHSRHQ